MVIDNAHQAGKPVGICGEMAADIRLLPLLIGLGLDELNVSTVSILKVKQAIRRLDFLKAETMAGEELKFTTAAEIQILLENQGKKF